jgi:hypothetical protein
MTAKSRTPVRRLLLVQRHEEIHTYDDDGREVIVERPVRRRGFRTTPSQVVSAVVGAVLVAFGIFAVVRAGLDSPLDDPRVDVLGLSHTALIGLIEIGIGAVLILCAFGYGTRVLSGLLGVALLAAGLVLLAEPGDLLADLNTDSELGWLGVITGGVLVLAALLAPRTAAR